MAEKTLQCTVHVDGVAYKRGTVPPADVAEKITNPKVWGETLAAPAPKAGTVTISTQISPAAQTTEQTPEPGDAVAYPVGLPDDTWTVKDLRAWAKDNDLTLGEAKAKPQILEAIAAHLGGAADEIEQTDPADPAE